MNGTNFYTRIHRLGRITVILALVCFMAVPFGLSAVYGQPLDFAAIVENGAPIFLTFAIAASLSIIRSHNKSDHLRVTSISTGLESSVSCAATCFICTELLFSAASMKSMASTS